MLLEELGVSTDERILWAAPPEQLRAVVPYNRAGARSRRLRSVLDLSPGQEVRLNPAHNCQGGSGDRASVPPWPTLPCPGSRQPSLRHVFSPVTAQEFQVVCRPPGPGRGTVKVSHLLHVTGVSVGCSAPGLPAHPWSTDYME